MGDSPLRQRAAMVSGLTAMGLSYLVLALPAVRGPPAWALAAASMALLGAGGAFALAPVPSIVERAVRRSLGCGGGQGDDGEGDDDGAAGALEMAAALFTAVCTAGEGIGPLMGGGVSSAAAAAAGGRVRTGVRASYVLWGAATLGGGGGGAPAAAGSGLR